tara:strand:+ start:795 stop:1928 length:1134 start_codon:yes stop_codon:yes gene_type:complete
MSLEMMNPFFCQTQVFTRLPFAKGVSKLANGHCPLLLTTAGWLERNIDKTVRSQLITDLVVADPINSHPKLLDIIAMEKSLPIFDQIIAVGGGSTIDAAKALAALRALDSNASLFKNTVIDATPFGDDFAPSPIVAIPTTSGTGSEVTRWGTLWGPYMEKYSIMHPTLYPTSAILDPTLCVSMPEDVTLYSGLDAISHAMEAIWNRNHTPASDMASTASIRALKRTLPLVLNNPDSLELRQQIQIAALYAGYAMGTTQTALAHSISYPFTAKFGLPHGFACSFSLGEVARYNTEADSARVGLIADAFDCSLDELPDKFHNWIKEMGVVHYLKNYIPNRTIDCIDEELINPARANNNIHNADEKSAKKIAQASLKALF